MTRESDELSVVRRVVMVVNIRASSEIVEGLKETDNLDVWRSTLVALEKYLIEQHENSGVEVYKFIGDGWILLFPEQVSKKSMMDFLTGFSNQFCLMYDVVPDFLQDRHRPEIDGLTFGIASGDLVRLELDGRIEYIGFLMNLAARLQDSAKKVEPWRNYQAVFYKDCFNGMAPKENHGFPVETVAASLRNLAGVEQIECIAYCPLQIEYR